MIKLPESLQEIFDVVSVKALEQGRKCENELTGGCSYRAGNLRCFIGFIIPDEEYHEGLEGWDIAELMRLNQVETNMPETLYQLQRIHDTGNIYPEFWPDHFRDFAKRFNLSTDKMDAYLSAKEV